MNAMQKAGPPEEPDTTSRLLREDGGLLATIIDSIHTGVAVVDPQGRFVHVNQAYCDIHALSSRELVGQRYIEKIAFSEEQAYLRDIHDAVFHGLNVRPHEVRVHRPDGRDVWTEIACRLIAHGEHSFCLISVQDITERKQLEQGLQSLATTDSLTGIANRRHFFELSAREMKRAQRSGKRPALLMIDLDNFKELNDACGHAAGDRVLTHFAAVCQACLRETDVFGRLGGEEFAVLLPETERRKARQIADRLRESFAASCADLRDGAEMLPARGDAATEDAKKSPGACTVSIGVAMVGPEESSVEPAMHRADEALYCAKEAGRNRVAVSNSPPSEG